MTVPRPVGTVSAWTGVFPTEDALFGHVAMAYPDGGSAESAFLRTWPVGPYDEDLAEAGFLASHSSPQEAVALHSYAASFAAELVADLARRPEATALYLVYDLDASGVVPAGEGPMRFLGAYRYVPA